MKGKADHAVIEESVLTHSSFRNVITQPLIVSAHGTQGRYNTRKLNELALHLLKSGRIEELKKQVCADWVPNTIKYYCSGT